MRNFGLVFSRLVDNCPKGLDDIAQGLGISRTYIYDLKKKESVDLGMLDKICRFFEVSPLIFFDTELLKFNVPSYEINEYNNTALIGQATMNVGLLSDVQNLKQIIAEKERFIQFLLHGKEAADSVKL